VEPWAWSAQVGVLLGVLAFLLLLVPIMGFQYRHYGEFTPRRLLGAAAASVYGTSLLAYTLLPLPTSRGDWCAVSAVSPQWHPLHFIADISAAEARTGPFDVLSSPVTLQVLFNVLLFVPWGVMVRGFWGRSITVATGAGLLASLTIETTQLTGLWGIYECAYREFDVDDVLTNTLGAFIGAGLARWLLWWMPRPHSFDATREIPRPVTSMRRWLGMAVDLAAFNALGFALVVAYRIAQLVATGEVPSDTGLGEAVLYSLVPALCVFVLPAWHGTGASLGQRAVRLVPVWDHRPSAGLRLRRAMAVGGVYGLAQFYARWQDETAWGDVARALAYGLLLAAFLAVPLTGRRGLSAVLTGARFEDDRALVADTSRR
jgi:glycopeptide antibiotics resistance protein